MRLIRLINDNLNYIKLLIILHFIKHFLKIINKLTIYYQIISSKIMITKLDVFFFYLLIILRLFLFIKSGILIVILFKLIFYLIFLEV